MKKEMKKKSNTVNSEINICFCLNTNITDS